MEVHGSVDRVIDGDTIVTHLRVLPGLELHGIHVRIEGINAPEIRTEAGKLAAEYAKTLLPADAEFVLTTTKQDKYGRILGKIVANGKDFGAEMIAAGYATKY
jgi:micrococcal nuclease